MSKKTTTALFLTLPISLLACSSTPKVPDSTPEEPAVEDAARVVPEDERWRQSIPAPGEQPELVMPTFEETRLENGMRIIASRRSELPLVSFNLAFLAGEAAEPEGKAGLAQLTYDLLLEGAGELDAMALADSFADLGASPYASVDADGGLVGVRVLKRNAEAALSLLAEVALRPAMTEEDFERKKQEHLADLAGATGNPRWLASEVLSAQIFGDAHPYGQPACEPALASLTLEDVREFYRRAVAPGRAALVVTGDIDLERAEALAREHFGDWASEDELPEPPAAPSAEAREREKVVLLERPGLEQTVIVLGRPSIEAAHEDELALLLAGQVFGGMFGSRLNLNLREDKGYTYGAFSRVQARRGIGPLTAGSSVHAEVTGAALQEIFSELRGLKEEPITEEEFLSAREGFVRSMPSWFETVEALARTGAILFWRDLSLDRYDRIAKGLEEIELEEVQAAAERYFDPTTMQVVLVGDPSLVEEQLDGLDLGELEHRAPLPCPPKEDGETESTISTD